jgi:hypothetical protein
MYKAQVRKYSNGWWGYRILNEDDEESLTSNSVYNDKPSAIAAGKITLAKYNSATDWEDIV